MNNQNIVCYFLENSFNEPVSSLYYNKEYDILATSNGTRHYPNILIDESEENRKLYEEKNYNENFEMEKAVKNIDDIFLPSYFKLWKFQKEIIK